MKGVKLFLEGIGEDPKRGGLKDTPRRVAEMCEEIFAGIGVDAGKEIKVLKSEDHDEIVLLKNISFFLFVSIICFPLPEKRMLRIYLMAPGLLA